MTASSQTYAARVVAVEDISPDIRILKVEIDNQQRLGFKAGQYLMLAVEGVEPRAFSIASAPDEMFLEFHIRNSGQGISAYIFDALKLGTALMLEGPMGANIWQAGDRPLLILAGGIGIAPMKAIIDAHLSLRGTAPVHLYWGVRNKEQLYLDHYFRNLAKKHTRFFYIPVLSDEHDADFRKGFVGNAVGADFESVHGYSVYMAGPKIMVDTTMDALELKNAEKDYIFSDAFSI